MQALWDPTGSKAALYKDDFTRSAVEQLRPNERKPKATYFGRFWSLVCHDHGVFRGTTNGRAGRLIWLERTDSAQSDRRHGGMPL